MMRWVRINNAHFNLALIKAFYWANGRLFIYWLDEEGEAETFEDKDRANYERLCCYIGAAPIGVEADGKK